MNSSRELFADGLLSIIVTDGVVRFDLAAQSPTKQDSNGQAEMECRQRLVMPLGGFLKMFQAMEGVVEHLIKDGVVLKNSDRVASQESPIGTSRVSDQPAPSLIHTPAQTPGRSPNFPGLV